MLEFSGEAVAAEQALADLLSFGRYPATISVAE